MNINTDSSDSGQSTQPRAFPFAQCDMEVNRMMFRLPSLVEQNIKHFTGRAWLLPHLLEWLEKTNERLFILSGNPGTGKTAIALHPTISAI